MKMSGQTNKRLCGLVSISGDALTKDTRLTSEDVPGKEIGRITSAAKHAPRKRDWSRLCEAGA